MGWQISGVARLGRDPELKEWNGTAIASLALVANSRKKGEDVAVWMDASAFGKLGEVMSQHLSKGDQVFVAGEMSQDSWTDKNTGELKTKNTLRVQSFDFVGKPKENQQQPPQQPPVQQQQYQYQRPQYQHLATGSTIPTATPATAVPTTPPAVPQGDDIPF